MWFLDRTCATPREDVAYDEALLAVAERCEEPLEALRVWESTRPAVVIGRSSSLAGEVRVDECRRRDVPILRRTSGGTAVVIGPGCLMYSVVLSYDLRPELRAIDVAHRFVLSTVLEGIKAWLPEAVLRGTSDLAFGERKFSGNSLRCRRRHLLYHGTLLYDFNLELITELLQTSPPRQPEYRAGRSHLEFVANMPARPESLKDGLRRAFCAVDPSPGDAELERLEATAEFAAAAAQLADDAWTSRVP